MRDNCLYDQFVDYLTQKISNFENDSYRYSLKANEGIGQDSQSTIPFPKKVPKNSADKRAFLSLSTTQGSFNARLNEPNTNL